MAVQGTAFPGGFSNYSVVSPKKQFNGNAFDFLDQRFDSAFNFLGGKGGNKQPPLVPPGSEFDIDKAKGAQKNILDSILGDIAKSRSGRQANIEADAKDLESSSLATLSDRGFASSNLDPIVRGSAQRTKDRALNELESSLLGQSAAAKGGYAGNLLSLQRGQQSSADQLQSQLLQLFQSLGAGGGGQSSIIYY